MINYYFMDIGQLMSIAVSLADFVVFDMLQIEYCSPEFLPFVSFIGLNVLDN